MDVLLIMTIWAATMNQFKFGTGHNLRLQIVNVIILVIAACPGHTMGNTDGP